MAIEKEGKGDTAGTICIVLILMASSFIAGGFAMSDVWGNDGGSYTNYNTNTNTNTTNDTTTTTTPTQNLPPADTTYKIYVKMYYTDDTLFYSETSGVATLLSGDTPDDTWTLLGHESTSDMIGTSPVKRHTKSSLNGKTLVLKVDALNWEFTIVFEDSWVLMDSGIGDYSQTYTLNSGQALDCVVYLTPRYTG